jgi:glutamyl-Q tRNA(Asp) synthetase
MHGIEGPVYPGTCRNGIPPGKTARAWRVRADLPSPVIEFDDALQGRIRQNLATEIGDFIIKRADGLFAYQLAVVVDDAFQHITHVVRGADLLTSTPRQIHLQRLLGLPAVSYLHLPIAVNAAGEKLSKQTLAAPLDARHASAELWRALDFLQQQPPRELMAESPRDILAWGIKHWDRAKLKGRTAHSN